MLLNEINRTELVEWIYKNQGNGFFEDYPLFVIETIIYNFHEALPDSDMLIEQDHEGVLGLVLYRVLEENRILYINQLKAQTTETFITLMEKLVQDFPGYTFVGNREHKYGGKIVYAHPEKLLKQAKQMLQQVEEGRLV